MSGNREDLELAGNAPLPLGVCGDGRGVWLIEEGTVEVFAVPRDASGPRTHLWTASAGQMLCGLEGGQNGHGLSLLAVGHPRTRLRRLSESEVRELARDPAAAADLSARLDAWLSGLFGEKERLPTAEIEKIVTGRRLASGRRLMRLETLRLSRPGDEDLEFVLAPSSAAAWRSHLGLWAVAERKSAMDKVSPGR